MGFAELLAAADRAALSHLGGGDVTYQPAVGSAVVVQGIFDDNYVLFTNEGEIRGPAVFLRLEDLPIHPDDDGEGYPVLTIEGTEYRVRGRVLDGLGGVHLVLS